MLEFLSNHYSASMCCQGPKSASRPSEATVQAHGSLKSMINGPVALTNQQPVVFPRACQQAYSVSACKSFDWIGDTREGRPILKLLLQTSPEQTCQYEEIRTFIAGQVV